MYHKLPSNQEEDLVAHQAIKDSLAQDYGLHASPSWQYVASTIGEPRFPPIDALPRTWKDSLKPDQQATYGFTSKQIKYQELLYEIILTEQSYVDDLILVYKIFIKETLRWDGLPAAVKHLFENLFQIIRLHLQLLKELRARQMEQHPVIHSITDICRSFISRFEIYSAYFSNFEKASNMIMESIRIKDELGSFISRRSSWTECRNLPFSAYLLTPIQRVMKYPLFFKSLSDCLLPTDGEYNEIQIFLKELDVILRYFEKQKKESEDFLKLEDLACRIKGLEGSTIRLAVHGRKLIYEGYLSLVPASDASTYQSVRLEDSSGSFASSLYKPTLNRKNSSFSLSSKKMKRAYVFLFNDMIVCTSERDKKRSSPTENRAMGPPPRKGSYYGPSPHTLFKITHTPGKITLVDRTVTREVQQQQTLSRRSSALFQSLKRYSSRQNEDLDNHSIASPSSEISQNTYFTSQSCNDLYHHRPNVTLERHPLQFICSVATRNLTNLHFEAETAEEKDIWCHHMESVLSEHVQRTHILQQQQQQQQQQQFEKEPNQFSSSTSMISPTHSTCSFESISSSESNMFVSSWTGYCDVERMDIDDTTEITGAAGGGGGGDECSTGSGLDNKSQELLQTIMGEFGDTIWSMNSPAGMSPYQLRQTFSNVGSQL
ncbi:Dbl homology domain-containing protein [Pilaira anomala]|nr:Dbl homology domain-containing protein [Pilaira anomala]